MSRIAEALHVINTVGVAFNSTEETRECSRCGKEKPLEEFGYRHNRLDKHHTVCRECFNASISAWVVVNHDKAIEHRRKYDRSDRGRAVHKTNNHKRRERKKGLPHELSAQDYKVIHGAFNNRCAYTGKPIETIHDDHFIAIATGHGGGTWANMVPAEASINLRKCDRNPFDFIEQLINEGTTDGSFFYGFTVPYLADQAGQTVNDFIEHVNWCYNNKKE